MNTKIFTHLFNQIKPLFALLWFACLLSAGSAVGQSTEWLSPSSNTGTGGGVLLPENAYTSDNLYAYFDLNGDNVIYSGFTISIPEGKVIKGVEMRLEAHKIPTSARDFKLFLSWDGGTNFVGPKITTGIPESVLFDDAMITVGGVADNWGWSPTTFTNFRVKVEVTSGWDYTDVLYLDHLQVRITYGAPNSILFDSNSQFVVPSCVSSITVQAWGGGGAGGGSTNAVLVPSGEASRAGAGGGGGAYVAKELSVTSGTTLNVVVGTGGTGASGAKGTNGNASTITGLEGQIYAAGGLAGNANTAGGTPAGGGGGSALTSKGDIVIAGFPGGFGGTSPVSSPSLTSGSGGNGANEGGTGGAGISSGTSNGNLGNTPGGGGSGARTFDGGGNRAGGNGAAGRVIITWIVNTTLPPTGDAAQIICNNGTLSNLVVSGSNIKWYAAASGGAALDVSTPLVNGTTYYASQTIDGCESVSRLAVTVTINKPDPPEGPSPQNFCTSATVSNLSAAGTAIKWYNVATGGTALDAGTSLQSGATYYASQTIDGCESIDRLAVDAVIIAPGPPTGASIQTFCNSAILDQIEVNGYHISWYNADNVWLSHETPVVNGQTYYAKQRIEGCQSVDRLAVTVNITTTSKPTGDAAQTFCNSATVGNLVANGEGYILWYDEYANWLSSDMALTSGATYYASQIMDECESADRLAVTVTINKPYPPEGEKEQTLCSGATVGDLQLGGKTFGFIEVPVIKWYAADKGGDALDKSTALVSGTTYYASQVIDLCESVERLAVKVILKTTPKPDGVTEQTLCKGATVAYLKPGNGGEGITEMPLIKWYDVASGGTPLDGTTLLVSGKTYYASQTIGDCESPERLAVLVTVNDPPPPPTGSGTQPFCNSANVSDLKADGTYINWYDGEGALLDGETPLANGAHYFASQWVDGCQSEDRLDVTVVINTPPAPTGTSPQALCQGATVADLRPTTYVAGLGPIQSEIKWYNALGALLNSTDALVNGAHYFASQTIDGCESIERLDVLVAISIPGITGTLNVCAGLTSQLSGNGTPAAINPWTSSDETVATVNSSGLVSGVKAGTITITYTNDLGCSKQESFVVKPLPQPTFVVKPTSPQSTGVNLVYTTESGMQSYSWTYSDAAQGLSNPCGYTRTGGGNTNSSTIKWRTEGEKTVKVSYSSDGCAAAEPVIYTISLCHPVSITTQPAVNIAYQYTCTVPTLSVAAKYTNVCTTLPGYDGLTYQWYSNLSSSNSGGTKIEGATAATFTPPANGVGDYYYYVVVTRNSCSAISSVAHIKVDPAPVEPVEATFLYKGPTQVWTSGPTSNVASVPLLVHIKNATGQCGDITTARVSFYLRNSASDSSAIPGATNLPVSYIDPNNPAKGGAASAFVQFNIGSSPSEVLDIVVKVSGNYVGLEEFQVTIARPTPGGLICGGMLLCNTNSTGFIKGASTWNLLPMVSKLNFYVDYNRSLKNPQGKVTLFVPSYNKPDGTIDKVLHWYTIRSNAISSLVVKSPTASFISKANVAEWRFDPYTLLITETLLEGNCKLVMDMTDNSPDKVGITVYRNKGGIWYANNWVGGKTEQQAICLGSLTVTGVDSGPSNYLTRQTTLPATTVAEPFDVSVQSNPTSDRFILKVSGSLERIDIKVMDINGKVVEVRNHLASGTPVYLGGNYIAGVYFAEVSQGPNRKMIKLVKQ